MEKYFKYVGKGKFERVELSSLEHYHLPKHERDRLHMYPRLRKVGDRLYRPKTISGVLADVEENVIEKISPSGRYFMKHERKYLSDSEIRSNGWRDEKDIDVRMAKKALGRFKEADKEYREAKENLRGGKWKQV